jgi:hypothetical protein
LIVLDLVIPDSGPLITFGLLNRLDLLDRFKCAIMITDMVSYEVLRGSGDAADRPIFQAWFAKLGNRIQTIETTYGAMWREIPPEAQQRIKRLHPNAGELSIRELTDKLKHTIPPNDQVLVLFEDDSVKRISFGPHVHLIHTFAFMVALENLGVIPSAAALHDEVLAKGRKIARDTFERRAIGSDGSPADWQSDYSIGDADGHGAGAIGRPG